MAVFINVGGRLGTLTTETLALFKREKLPMPEVRKAKLSDLKQDRKNLNMGSERGQAMIEKSFSKYGAGRSLVLDKNGTILCGNHSAEAAASIGMDEVVIVPTNGDQIVAVQRMDLDANDPRAQELAIADNRSNEISLHWNPEALQENWDNPELDLSPFFTEGEVLKIFEGEEIETIQDEDEDDLQPDLFPENHLQIKVIAGSHEEKIELAEELEGRGFKVTI